MVPRVVQGGYLEGYPGRVLPSSAALYLTLNGRIWPYMALYSTLQVPGGRTRALYLPGGRTRALYLPGGLYMALPTREASGPVLLGGLYMALYYLVVLEASQTASW